MTDDYKSDALPTVPCCPKSHPYLIKSAILIWSLIYVRKWLMATKNVACQAFKLRFSVYFVSPPPRKQPSVKFKESDGEVDGRGNIIYGAIDFGTVNTGFALGMPSYRSMQVTLIGNDLREQSEILLDETKQLSKTIWKESRRHIHRPKSSWILEVLWLMLFFNLMIIIQKTT